MRTVAPYEVGITVADLDRVLDFYVRVLRLRVLSDVRVPAEIGRRTGLAPGAYRVVRLESPSGDRFKLAQPAAPPAEAPPAAVAMQRRGGPYVTFIVDDLDQVQARLAAAGVPVRSQGAVEVRPGLRLLLVTDPEGNFVEIVQYDDVTSYRPIPQG